MKNLIKNKNLKHRDDSYCNEPEPDRFAPDWMKDIDGGKLLTELSIPGTHDSCALYGTIFAECQSWKLPSMLRAGIRFIDIRCRHLHNAFVIYHGVAFQFKNFTDVLTECQNFLAENPSETIIMKIQQEYEAEDNTESFEETFLRYNKAYKDLIYIYDGIPKLDQVRGKIFLMQRGFYVGAYDFDDSFIQDDYQIPDQSKIPKKIDEILDMLKMAVDGDPKEFYINHCSGTGLWYTEPTFVASKTNKTLFSFSTKGRIGIYIMDFPGEIVIESVINRNKD